MNKQEIVWDCLKKNKEITTLEIQQLVWTTCPHSIIRDLREKHTDYIIFDEWITKKRQKELKEGKFYWEVIRYKKYKLQEV